MYTDTPKDVPTHELSDSKKWITKTGKVLRKTSLDELPQLFCILKGDMSIIGPRPAGLSEIDLIEEREKYQANGVLPGLTGLAQISGRDVLASDIKKKAEIDGEYAKKITFGKDFKIFFKTIGVVLKGTDVVEGDNVLKQDGADTKEEKENS
jgi:O-antigen biosynthesis protein WbqP